MSTEPFADVFGAAPEMRADAPGRVNLLGEHTDYNDGFVLPIAIGLSTHVAMRRRPDGPCELYAEGQGPTQVFDLDAPPRAHFASYVYGCLKLLERAGAPVVPVQIHVHSNVPIGVGLSSSAALAVATLRCLRGLLEWPLDDVALALMARAAEVEFAGVNVGIMDQMACSLAQEDQALFLDTRTLERRLVPLPEGCAVLVLDSGVPRSLAATAYNQRRSECEEAARLLGIASLRDVMDEATLGALPERLQRRARHVMRENQRVLAAVATSSPEEFGALMNASHASLRDDYEVSIEPLDRLVAGLQQQDGVFGARLTGAGFGGACVALCRKSALEQVSSTVLALYARQGGQGARLVPAA